MGNGILFLGYNRSSNVVCDKKHNACDNVQVEHGFSSIQFVNLPNSLHHTVTRITTNLT